MAKYRGAAPFGGISLVVTSSPATGSQVVPLSALGHTYHVAVGNSHSCGKLAFEVGISVGINSHARQRESINGAEQRLECALGVKEGDWNLSAEVVELTFFRLPTLTVKEVPTARSPLRSEPIPTWRPSAVI